MKVKGVSYKTIWFDSNKSCVKIIDQSVLPHKFRILDLVSLDDAVCAISKMKVRGAPLIGCTGAYGVYLATRNFKDKESLIDACDRLIEARPTAVNLEWGVKKVLKKIFSSNKQEKWETLALEEANRIAHDDEINCKLIGKFGYSVLGNIQPHNNESINILTHCNAGWLATVDWGTATAPIYYSKHKGLDVHVWVDETRPRMQGALLTSYELNNESIKNTIISDNTGGYLMLNHMVDICITGADRVMGNGDVINKIGTYEKAVLAYEHNIPFYVAIPCSTIDTSSKSASEVIIENRCSTEMSHVSGVYNNNYINIQLYHEDSDTLNIAFDVTPHKYITGIITERGICNPNKESLHAFLK